MLMSQLALGSSPELWTTEEHVYRVLHYGHAEQADVSASHPAVVPAHYEHEEHVYPVLHYGHYAGVSASTPAVVPEHGGHESMSTRALHYGHAEYADVSASTPAVVPEHYGHEEHVYRVLHYGRRVYDVSASTPAVVPEHHGREAGLCAALWTHRVLMSQLTLRHDSRSTMGTKNMSRVLHHGHAEYADVSASTPAVVPGAARRVCLRVLHYGHAEHADVSASTPAVVPAAHYEHERCLPCAALWTHRYADVS
jgi:hypothetical protein